MTRHPLTPENRRILIFTIAYMVLFTGIAVWRQNVEFLYYMALMTGLVAFVVVYHQRLHLSTVILNALSLVGLLHVMGGNIHVGGRRLYDTYLIQDVVRYDNLVHSFGIFVFTLTLYSAIMPHMDKTVRGNGWALSTILVMMGMGAGAIIEVVEFAAVAFLDAHEQVGGYWNNALDLTFNLAGAVAATVGIQWHRRRESETDADKPRTRPSATRRPPGAGGTRSMRAAPADALEPHSPLEPALTERKTPAEPRH